MRIGDLSRIVAGLRDGGIAEEDASMLASAFEAYLAGNIPSLDAALGLRPGPGQRRPATRAAQGEYDHLLVDTAIRFFPMGSARKRAAAFATKLRRYRDSVWLRRDRTLPVCPYRETDLNASLWYLLKLKDREIAAGWLRQKLAGELARFRLPKSVENVEKKIEDSDG